MILRAKAPLRISFGGGGSDVSPYCDERGGAVLSATVNRFAYAGLRPGGDRFHVRSLDYDVSVSYELDEPFVFDGQLDLAKAVIDSRVTSRFQYLRSSQDDELALRNGNNRCESLISANGARVPQSGRWDAPDRILIRA